MLAEEKTKRLYSFVEARTLEVREVTFRASPLSTSKEHTHTKKKSRVMFNILNNLTMYIIRNDL